MKFNYVEKPNKTENFTNKSFLRKKKHPKQVLGSVIGSGTQTEWDAGRFILWKIQDTSVPRDVKPYLEL